MTDSLSSSIMSSRPPISARATNCQQSVASTTAAWGNRRRTFKGHGYVLWSYYLHRDSLLVLVELQFLLFRSPSLAAPSLVACVAAAAGAIASWRARIQQSLVTKPAEHRRRFLPGIVTLPSIWIQPRDDVSDEVVCGDLLDRRAEVSCRMSRAQAAHVTYGGGNQNDVLQDL